MKITIQFVIMPMNRNILIENAVTKYTNITCVAYMQSVKENKQQNSFIMTTFYSTIYDKEGFPENLSFVRSRNNRNNRKKKHKQHCI